MRCARHGAVRAFAFVGASECVPCGQVTASQAKIATLATRMEQMSADHAEVSAPARTPRQY